MAETEQAQQIVYEWLASGREQPTRLVVLVDPVCTRCQGPLEFMQTPWCLSCVATPEPCTGCVEDEQGHQASCRTLRRAL